MLAYEPGLMEEAVLHASRGHREERAFRRARDRAYEIPEPEAREAAFRELHAAWFERLGLGLPLAQALSEQPSIAAETAGCRVGIARSRQEEGAELFVGPPRPGVAERERRWVVIRLRSEAVGAADRLLAFLRHELFHIADMLEPGFGYEPRLRPEVVGPFPERLLRDRYRVLWDATIDGRLVHRGLASPAVRTERFREFARSFPMLGACAEETFARFFDGSRFSHADLVAFAAHPGGALGTDPSGPHPGERCPLCRFPTHAFEPDPSALPGAALERLREEFPKWAPGHGLCQQCADLYRARAVAGGEALPAQSGGPSGGMRARSG